MVAPLIIKAQNILLGRDDELRWIQEFGYQDGELIAEPIESFKPIRGVRTATLHLPPETENREMLVKTLLAQLGCEAPELEIDKYYNEIIKSMRGLGGTSTGWCFETKNPADISVSVDNHNLVKLHVPGRHLQKTRNIINGRNPD